MSSGNLLDTLNTSQSGLRVGQIQVEVTGKNVANANDTHYTRQRVVAQPLPRFITHVGWHIETGGGVKSVDIQRVFNEFVYNDHRKALADLEHATYLKDNLKNISGFFPELEGFGIANEMRQYFDAWSNLTANPNEPASKITLIKTASNLALSLRTLRGNLSDIQQKVNNEIKTYIAEVNATAQEIAHINKEILTTREKQKIDNVITVVNELRDRRDALEMTLAKLLPVTVDRRTITSNSIEGAAIVETGDNYVLNVAGFNLIDGVDYSTLITKGDSTADNLFNIKYVRQDEREFDISSYLRGSKVGALLKLRGDSTNAKNFTEGYLQKYIRELDQFTNGLINATNSIYAKTKATYLASDIKKLKDSMNESDVVINQSLGIREGSFFVNMFDKNDKLIAQKEIFIEKNTTMGDILKQFNSNSDDNLDGSPTNDIDDKFRASFINDTFSIQSIEDAGKYFISIDDKDTNFAGGLSLRTFFSGIDAKDIEIDYELNKNPEELEAYVLTNEGKDLLGNYMNELQYKEIKFFQHHTGETKKVALSDYLNDLMATISTDAKIAIQNHKTFDKIYQTIKETYDGMSKVNIDEELTNLMKFQSGYVANAKVLTTVDEMLTTLLGIKQ